MKKCLLIAGIIAALAGFSCKKSIQQKEESLIIQAMTDGRWYVQLYMDTTTDITSDFAAYQFQFYQNGQVDGITPTLTQSGTWAGDINNYTITASFPASTSDTLQLLNHVWKITDSYTNYVEASTTTASGTNILHLMKQ